MGGESHARATCPTCILPTATGCCQVDQPPVHIRPVHTDCLASCLCLRLSVFQLWNPALQQVLARGPRAGRRRAYIPTHTRCAGCRGRLLFSMSSPNLGSEIVFHEPRLVDLPPLRAPMPRCSLLSYGECQTAHGALKRVSRRRLFEAYNMTTQIHTCLMPLFFFLLCNGLPAGTWWLHCCLLVPACCVRPWLLRCRVTPSCLRTTMQPWCSPVKTHRACVAASWTPAAPALCLQTAGWHSLVPATQMRLWEEGRHR
jgi:hypothetical protein